MTTRIVTIKSSDLAACPTHTILPRHYRADGSCLHNLKDREPVRYESDVRDDGPREYYSGSTAVILGETKGDDGPRYLLEFPSGTTLLAEPREVTPIE